MNSATQQQESLEQQVQALKDLIEVARAVVSTIDLDTVLHAILESAMRFAEVPAGSIALFEEEKEELVLHAHAGLSDDFVRRERWGVDPDGFLSRVLRGRETVFVEDTGKTDIFNDNPVALREGIRSLISIPLILHERPVGVLCLDDFQPRQFNGGRMSLLSILASFAAMSIDNAKLHRRTRLMAITDSLTGLYNHRYFHHVLSQEVDRARRYRKPLSLIMMDVDDFKGFNDRYGHPRGDKALANVGELIAATLRSVDSAFRYGGEEFMVLLPETSMRKAVTAAERMRQAIERDGIVGIPGVREPLTVSIGVVSFPQHARSAQDLLDAVDRLLYDAKDTGKNRVVRGGGSPRE